MVPPGLWRFAAFSIDEEAVARRGVDAVRAAFPEDQVRTYLNTLWLQDHDRWEALERAVK